MAYSGSFVESEVPGDAVGTALPRESGEVGERAANRSTRPARRRSAPSGSVEPPNGDRRPRSGGSVAAGATEALGTVKSVVDMPGNAPSGLTAPSSGLLQRCRMGWPWCKFIAGFGGETCSQTPCECTHGMIKGRPRPSDQARYWLAGKRAFIELRKRGQRRQVLDHDTLALDRCQSPVVQRADHAVGGEAVIGQRLPVTTQ